MKPKIEGDLDFECVSCKEAGNFTVLSTRDASRREPGEQISKYYGIKCPRCGKSWYLEATWTAKVEGQ